MKESTVSAPFMKQMRERLPGSVVIKHSDKSMIGVMDCSITWRRRPGTWVEFKLVNCPMGAMIPTVMRKRNAIKPDYDWKSLVTTVGKKSPTQWEFSQKMGREGLSFHVVWIRKTCVLVMDHAFGTFVVLKDTREAVDWIAMLLETGLTGWVKKESPEPKSGAEGEELLDLLNG